MGPGGSKMCEFDDSRSSLQPIWPTALQLPAKTPSSLSEGDWSHLKNVYCEIRCTASRISPVGNAKVMADRFRDSFLRLMGNTP